MAVTGVDEIFNYSFIKIANNLGYEPTLSKIVPANDFKKSLIS